MRWQVSLLCVALVAPLPGRAAAHPDLATLQALEVTELQFMSGGSTLTPQERQTCDELVTAALRADAARAYKNDDEAASQLEKSKRDPAFRAELREVWRTGYVFLKDVPANMLSIAQTEQRILASHDPVIAIDQAHERVVTRASLKDLHQAADWISVNANVPKPGPDFNERATTLIQDHFAQMDDATQDGLAHIGRNAAYLQVFFAKADTQRKSALMARLHASLSGAPDPSEETRRLVQTASVMAASAEKLTMQSMTQQYAQRSMGGTHAIMRGLIDRQLQQNVWSMRHAECAPGGGNPSSCGQAPIFRSVPVIP